MSKTSNGTAKESGKRSGLTRRRTANHGRAVSPGTRDRWRDHGAASRLAEQLDRQRELRVLEAKGAVKHQEQGLRYVYLPTVPRHSARRSALKHLVDTFFDGSSAKAVAALLGGETRVSDEELERIAELVKAARSESR